LSGLGGVLGIVRRAVFLELIFGARSGGCCGGFRALSAAGARPGAAAGLSRLLLDRAAGAAAGRAGANHQPPATLQVRRHSTAVGGRTGPHGRATRTGRRSSEAVPSTPPRRTLLHQIDDLLAGQSPHREHLRAAAAGGQGIRFSFLQAARRLRLEAAVVEGGAGDAKPLIPSPATWLRKRQWRSDRGQVDRATAPLRVVGGESQVRQGWGEGLRPSPHRFRFLANFAHRPPAKGRWLMPSSETVEPCST